MIKMLSDSSGSILDTKKSVISIEETSTIKKKLNFGGFLSNYAESLFYFISITFGILVGFFIYMVMLSPIAFLISTLLFSLFPYMILEKIISNRQEEFNFGLRGIIDKVTSMMRSGVGFEQAFKKAILTTKSEFTQSIFNIYIKEKDIIGEDKAFEKMFKLVESKELRIFYLVISIGRESGGKFSNTLDTLRKTLQDQGTIRQEIVSSTKEIKIGTYMIIGLTVGIYIMMNNVFKGALNEHFFGSSEGKLQMFFIIIWVSFGIFVNNMMTKIKE
jgi:tight adherence protein B